MIIDDADDIDNELKGLILYLSISRPATAISIQLGVDVSVIRQIVRDASERQNKQEINEAKNHEEKTN